MTVSIGSGGGAFTTGDILTETTTGGDAAFTNLGHTLVAPFTLTFTSNTHTVTSLAITMLPGQPVTLTFTQAAASTGTVDNPLTTQPIVHIVDQYGNNVAAGTAVTAYLFSGTGVLTPGSTLTETTVGTTGDATFTNIGYEKAADPFVIGFDSWNTILATSEYAFSGSLTILPGAAKTLTLSPGTPASTGTVDNPLSTQPIVNVVDQYGNNVVAGTLVTASRATGSGNLLGTLTANTVGASGNATFTNIGYDKANESFTITFTSNTYTVTSGSLTMLPGAATHAAISATSTNLPAGSTSTITATLEDQFNNTVTSDNSSYVMFSADGRATYVPHLVRVTSGVGSTVVSDTTAEIIHVSITANPWITPPADVTITFTASFNVAITAPSAGATVNGAGYTVYFNNNGGATTAAQISIDGGAWFTPTSSTSYTWNTTALTNGTHTIQVYDTVGGITVYSQTISVIVSNIVTPTISLVGAAVLPSLFSQCGQYTVCIWRTVQRHQ